MKPLAAAKQFLTDFISLIFPSACIGCHTILVHGEVYLCTSCRLSLPKTELHLKQENYLMQKFAYAPHVKRAMAYLYYNQGGIAQKIIHHIKYQSAKELAELIGKWYGSDLKQFSDQIDYIIPVPLHEHKLRKRGFNQSEYFAQGLGHVMKKPVFGSVVVRTKNTESQTRKSKVERWHNVNSIYQVTQPANLKGTKVLLVDDVLTTGATLGELVEVLIGNGVIEINIATIASGK